MAPSAGFRSADVSSTRQKRFISWKGNENLYWMWMQILSGELIFNY